MVDEFHGSKIMYGYVRVKEPNTGLPKFVFINWVSATTIFTRLDLFFASVFIVVLDGVGPR